jgi:DNA repair exonuclease SbcCD ATPase subunit
MPHAKYRIDELIVEGFRGFTEPQTLNVNQKNLFVFGQNGHGKSSIVEAIRWCLFGSGAGSDIEVRNTFYENQECRVSLLLKGDIGDLRIERELRPGLDRSRLSIRDSIGAEVRAGDVLPQLTRLGAHDGTQVIFAAQHAVGRQITTDISDFGRVLCYYLKLEDVPDILRKLRSLHEERRTEAEKLSAEVEQTAYRYREQRQIEQGQLSEILKNPPWGDGTSPTEEETCDRIKALLEELAGLIDQRVRSNLRPEQALQLADQWIEILSRRSSGDIEARLAQLSQQLSRVETCMSAAQNASGLVRLRQRNRRKVVEQLRVELGGKTVGQLQLRLQQLEQRQSMRTSCAAVADRVSKLCESYKLSHCPACGSTFEPPDLFAKAVSLSKSDEQALRDSEAITKLQQQLRNHGEITGHLQEIDDDINAEKERLDASFLELQSLFSLEKPETDIGILGELRDRIGSDVNALRRNLSDSRVEKSRRMNQVRGLREELSYHSHRNRIVELDRKLSSGMEDARQLLADYHNLITHSEHLWKLIRAGFRKALDHAIPLLDEMLSEVYQRLTQQRSYELVRVFHDPERIGNLELRVASKRRPEQDFPANVLNGQASKALHLVPYLVFSRFQPEILELDLLLIDDPSQSFDTSHMSLLVDELQEAARHAQVVVASHEEDKFLPQLEGRFADGSLMTVRVTGFDPMDGPQLEPR